MKKKSKKIGLNASAGAKWDSIFLCNGRMMFIKTSTGKKEIPFSFRSAISSFIL
jgi:hypothetical protein